MKTCIVEGCDGKHKARGLCSRHYDTWNHSGDPLVRQRRERGTGTLNHYGYHVSFIDGASKLTHTLVAETALGKPLPVGACVHHVNEIKIDNNNTNLVICPNDAYHKLLHRRMRALDACGNANWMKCVRCHQYDDPGKMYVSGAAAFHRECNRIYNRDRRAKASIGSVLQ